MSPQSGPDIPPPPAIRPDTPVPFGVQAETGHVRQPFVPIDPMEVVLDPKAIQERGDPKKHLAIIPTVDAKDPKQSGWAVLFASNADPAVIDALEPLISWRKQQVGDDALCIVFKNNHGVFPGQSAVTWLANKGVGLAVVDPENGIPYHILIVGSPEHIPFEFQYTLDMQWSVGRLDFDTPEEYNAYAKAVVAYEQATTLTQSKTAAMWMPANGDLATNLLCNDVGLPFFQKPLGKKQGFAQSSFFATEATKAKLGDILSGKAMANGLPPALLFTGSHGLEVSMADAQDQRARQGALVTQEWNPAGGVGANACFTGADVPVDAKVAGLIHVMFACFGGGCPQEDNYPDPGTLPKPIAPKAMVGRLPQRLLAQGALAVIGHVDRAWSFSFQSGAGLPQNQVLRSIIEGIMLGWPVGLAMDFTNLQWGTLAGQLGIAAGPGASPIPATLANLVIARDDARNYALFGDPMVRLRTDKMA